MSAEPEAAPAGLRTVWCGTLGAEDTGRRVTACGWVSARRDHGEHLVFVDLRDRTGLVQCVIDGGPTLRAEYVLAVEGTVRRRPPGTENPALPTGEVELVDCRVRVLSEAEPPPFPLSERTDAARPDAARPDAARPAAERPDGDRPEVDESVRLRYRYLDLRRPKMQANLRLRA
ncbi:MAG: hypothetical protein J2O38_07550, partial [Acidimicrobiales bacterium]|nr:hypothetical protein [Acidimicrobiales bacterium]